MDDRTGSAAQCLWIVAMLGCLALLSGCHLLGTRPTTLPAPVATHEFSFDPERDAVVGELQIIRAQEQDTLSDIARRFNLGYEELVSANPGVDPWLPHAGTEIVIPTRFVLPDAPREGVVVNLAAMRLFYFPPVRHGEPQRVITHPLGIGRVEWNTPEGLTKIIAKAEAPVWIPTASIHREHAANGDPLPAVVPSGPDNPLGTHALRLGWPKYSIHGTNKPPSIGLRGSHGCLRMYPEDIVSLYGMVPIGTPVRVVNQPTLFGWHGDTLYVQSYPMLEDDRRDQSELRKMTLVSALMSRRGNHSHVTIDKDLLDVIIRNPRAIAIPISHMGMTLEAYLKRVKRVENRPPLNATWVDEKGVLIH